MVSLRNEKNYPKLSSGTPFYLQLCEPDCSKLMSYIMSDASFQTNCKHKHCHLFFILIHLFFFCQKRELCKSASHFFQPKI